MFRVCHICKLNLPIESFYKSKQKSSGGRDYRCRDCMAKRRQVYNEAIRIEALIHYGGKCACCGFDDLHKRIGHMSFLHFDHIGGGGRTHCRKIPWLSHWLRTNNYPEGFRILCAPCNIAMLPNDITCELHKWERKSLPNQDGFGIEQATKGFLEIQVK